MSDDQRLGTAVQEVMESAGMATNFGKRVVTDTRHASQRTLQTSTTRRCSICCMPSRRYRRWLMLADELDPRETAVYQ